MNKQLTFVWAFLLSISLTAQVPFYVPSDSLVGFWDFNGNLDNSLTTGVTLSTTGSNGYTQDRNGNASSALSSGAAKQNSINGFNATQQFTLGGWVNPYLMPSANNAANYIGYFYRMEYEVNNTLGPPTVGIHSEFAFLSDFVLSGPFTPIQGPDYGKIYFQTVTGGVNRILKSNVNYTSNTWYHVMVNYDQSYLRLFVNGACTDSLAATGNLDYSNYNGGFQQTQFQTYVNYGNGEYTSTLLDKMGFWRRALTACEIDSLYHETLPCGGALNTSINHNHQPVIQLFPNPVTDIITIHGLENNTIYQLIDISGKVVSSEVINSLNNQINVVGIVNGIYFLNIHGFITQKIIINH